MNFWIAYKRDFLKIAAGALLVAAVAFVLGYSLVLLTGSAFVVTKFIAGFIITFLNFAFYCACAMFFFRADKTRFKELLAKYSYVPVILFVCGAIINNVSSYIIGDYIRSGAQLTVGIFTIPFWWMSVPGHIISGFIAALIIFVLLIAIYNKESWLKAWGMFLNKYKSLFAVFCWWQFCIGAVVFGLSFYGVDIFYKLGLDMSYLMRIVSIISLILESMLIYYVFQKISGARQPA